MNLKIGVQERVAFLGPPIFYFCVTEHRGNAGTFSITYSGVQTYIYVEIYIYIYISPWDFSGKESACQAGVAGLIPESERSPREGNGNPLQYSCLENSMDRGAWRATV